MDPTYQVTVSESPECGYEISINGDPLIKGRQNGMVGILYLFELREGLTKLALAFGPDQDRQT